MESIMSFGENRSHGSARRMSRIGLYRSEIELLLLNKLQMKPKFGYVKLYTVEV